MFHNLFNHISTDYQKDRLFSGLGITNSAITDILEHIPATRVAITPVGEILEVKLLG